MTPRSQHGHNELGPAARQIKILAPYTKDLDNTVAKVMLEAQTLERWADTLLLKSHKCMLDVQCMTSSQHLTTGKEVQILHQSVDELTSKLDRVNELGLIIPMVYNGFQPVLKEQWNRMSVQRLIDIISELTDVDTKTLVDIYRNRSYHESGPRHITSSETTAHDILRKLEFDRDLVPEDVEYLLRQCTVSAQQQIQPHRLRAIQDNSRIRAWLSVDSPSLLLVNGNAASHLDSTTAFFSAKVTNTLMHHVSQPHRNIEIVPLVYFCGQHQNYQKDVEASPEALAKSLLAQLVNAHKGFEAQVLQ